MPYKDPEKQKEYNRQYEKKRLLQDPVGWRKYNCDKAKKSHCKKRLLALTMLCNGEPICKRCGCKEIDILDVNHKNGDGGGKRRQYGEHSQPLWRNIVNGKRKTDDLEVLCKVCNWAHFVELKYCTKYQITNLNVTVEDK